MKKLQIIIQRYTFSDGNLSPSSETVSILQFSDLQIIVLK